MSDTIVSWLKNLPEIGPFNVSFIGSSADLTSHFFQNAIMQIATSVPTFLVLTLFFLLSLSMFLMHGKDLVVEFLSVIPDHLQSVTMQLKKDVVNTLYATYVVNLQVCLITFIIAIPFYALIGAKGGVIPNATLTAVSQLVPTIGPLFVLVFIGLYAIALGNIPLAITVIIIGYILFMFIPGSILRPKMMGKRISLPAPMMMIAIIGAIATVGLSGIILGPLFASLLVSGYRLLITQMKTMKGYLPDSNITDA
jgi:predicted PurR-regulated permease PerM